MSCCSGQNTTALSDSDAVKAVNDAYSARALRSGEDAQHSKAVAAAFGFTAEELSSVPAESYMGLSCGNPTAFAKLKEGERVLDLGSGGGIDVFLAASKVGQTGQAIGLDGSAEMVALARGNAAKQGLKPPHVAFVQVALEKDLPIESNSIDCIISNCVINLLPLAGKANALKEAFRVLKPGGRLVLDDIIARKPLPPHIKDDPVGNVNCISGAITGGEYEAILDDAGFKDTLFVDRKSDLNVYWQDRSSCCQGTTDLMGRPEWPQDFDVNEWTGSYEIYAVKPASGEPVTAPPTSLLRWWDAYPTVKASLPFLTAEEVATLVRDPVLKSNDKVAVIDVRRNDHAGGHVRGSEQWPAQTFYDDLPGFFERHKDTEKVIFYCQSSNGRGPRSAGWYQDYLDSKPQGEHTSKAYVLAGGIKGWKAKFTDDSGLLEYDP
ncbi:arsenite S-adenosylmethyltransferase [Coprinellus micaceus]|uniref:Arsenite methyltransferase n=1 Tax=Coprinellus micaceus TaxID=71717 RepID=A0A4Y7SVU0_COPMI|nr:arsenite S-adenosylmethyltransferase [Coprinellus micaceus]